MHRLKIALALLSIAPAACTLTIGNGTDSASAPATTATEGTSTSATDGTSTAATDSDTNTPTTDSDTNTPTTGSPTTPTEAADSSSTAVDMTQADDTGTPNSACGWVAETKIYACGGMGEDPDGFNPIECPEPPVVDAPCDGDQGPIADPGCCSDNISAYCYLGKLVVTDCS